MKTRIILCIIGLLGFLLIPSITAFSQPIPIIQGVGEFRESGTLQRDSTGKVIDIRSDTIIQCNAFIKVYEDALIIESEFIQDFSFGSRLDSIDTNEHYLVMFEAVDEEDLNCDIIVYYSKVSGVHVITVNYQNIYYRYYL